MLGFGAIIKMLECMAALGQPGAAFALPGGAGKCGSFLMYYI